MKTSSSDPTEVHIPCPCGKSSDAYVLYDDGHGFCYSCHKSFQPKGGRVPEVSNDKNKDKDNTDYLIKPQFGWRQDVVSLYDITTKTIDGKDYALGFPFANGSMKTRKFDPKNKSDKWSVIRNTKGESCVGLAGRQSFRPGSKTSVTVVEGLRDMPSMYQALDGRSAVVAVSSSSTALRDCSIREDFDFLNSFKKIVLAFDSDEPGERAKNAVA